MPASAMFTTLVKRDISPRPRIRAVSELSFLFLPSLIIRAPRAAIRSSFFSIASTWAEIPAPPNSSIPTWHPSGRTQKAPDPMAFGMLFSVKAPETQGVGWAVR